MEFVSHDLTDTDNFAKEFAKSIKDGDVILLCGDLGAGKTTFTKSVCKALGYQGEVTSPTFTLLNEYNARLPIFHFDMYRLKDANEAIESGLDEILRAGNGVCIVEWPEKVEGILPNNSTKIEIKTLGENERKFIITEAR